MRERYLNDSAFLKCLDAEHDKTQYTKITLLDWSEHPIQEIQGIVTSGNLNIDGNSSVRRTCNLNVFIEDTIVSITNPNSLLSLNKKISVEIGFKNKTDQYLEHDIFWFPIGIFVITGASVSHSTSGITVSLSLKDKMCLLNGEVGGTIPAAVDFANVNDWDENGNEITRPLTMYQIITEVVHHWGGEQLSKIIISDLDTKVKKVEKWTDDQHDLYIYGPEWSRQVSTSDPGNVVNKQIYKYGQDVGFVYTDFIYPNGELIGQAGSSLTSILDSIKNVLGNFEYFYDLDGNFVFQEVKNYLRTSMAKLEIDKITANDFLTDQSMGKAVYQFNDSSLITSYNNSPQYSMIKNDFIVWGSRTIPGGARIPIRYHVAIDEKPEVNNQFVCFKFTDPDTNITSFKSGILVNSVAELPHEGRAGIYYVVGSLATITTSGKVYVYNVVEDQYEQIDPPSPIQVITSTDWRSELYLQGSAAFDSYVYDSNYYYPELANEWPKLYNVETQSWNQEVLDDPSGIDYYLDFIDSNAAIGNLSVSNIGRRTKVLNDDKINCIFETDVPDLVLIDITSPTKEAEIQACIERVQEYVVVSNAIYDLLWQGGSQNSAFVAMRDLIYQYTSYNESITLQALPIYYLDVNTRISVTDVSSDIFGDYMIKTISIPLDINGVMSITATKALEKF